MHIHHLNEEDDDDLKNLATLCPPCHAVMHFGLSMKFRSLEIWKSPISQVEIVRQTREGIRRGLTLKEINAGLGLKRGELRPDSMAWANRLARAMGDAPRFELPEPLCAVFITFRRWQIAELESTGPQVG